MIIVICSLTAIAAAPIIEALETYAAIRRRRYRALPHFWRFGRGWLRRVDTTLARARQLTADEANRKSKGEPAMTTTSTDTKWWGHSITIWGTIVTILSTTLPALAPVTGVDVSGQLVQDAGRHVVEAIQAVGTLVGTLMTIYGRFRATSPITLTLRRDG
jgi:lysozyme family protein